MSADLSSISVSGTETVTADGQTTAVPFSGTLNVVPPTVTATTFTIAPNQSIAASSFFTVSAPGGDNITQYSFEDKGGGSGHFTLNGTVQPDGKVFTVSASNLSSVEYVNGSSVGTDHLTVEAFDATTGLSGNASLNAIMLVPTLTANSFNIAANQSIAALTFFTVLNPGGDNVTQYSFEDNGGGSGYFTVNGSAQPDGTAFTVSASNLSSVQYVGGASAGTDQLTVDAYDGTLKWSVGAASLNAITAAEVPFSLTSLSLDQQTELIYIGYYNRAADAGGFNFWEGQDATAQAGGQSAAVALTNIANSFAPQAETEAIYPFLSNPNPNFSNPTVQAGLATFVGNVYENLFDHAADSGGLSYWTGQIETGAVGLGAAVLAIAGGAQGSDATILQNKITVALEFTNLTSAANVGITSAPSALVMEANIVLAGVDGISLNDASVTAAEALIAPWIASQQAVALVGSAAPAVHELA